MSELFANIGLKKNEDGSLINGGEALKGKVVALYFSASWCPPCKTFTPILADFYSEASEMGLEIVFVSFDRSESDLNGYIKSHHGNWLHIPFGSEHIQKLAKQYGVSGIPALIVIKPNGDVITKEGRTEVSGGAPRVVMSNWKKSIGN
ncbi:Nucleoredoxin-like protein 2 [Strongyloides ratti]|uniref:protein-disulfide reductase n=1 Tax=Strongyloides ratti TaxID=34506 RepID=A0A090MYV6_STRRB|nr:Nucleoredoxin-like protein 2 [Strongyloides ratti]CEF67849.1 Nucleoredoxin-like protein 2 [Strongyloides ratti]